MKEENHTVPMMLQAPSREAVNARLRDVQHMFHRSLACWASDVLLLRQARLHHFAWRSDSSHVWADAAGQAA